jgi:hypothetical protein
VRRIVPTRVFDVAGVAIAVDAGDDARGSVVAAGLAGFADTDAPAVARLTIDDLEVVPPDRAPDSELLGIRFWLDGDGIVLSAEDVLVEVTGSTGRLHVPNLERATLAENCVYLPLTWLLARHNRFVLHGGAVARADTGLLLLGTSGAGKSSLAFAAWETGWDVLADDLVIVEPDTGDRSRGFRIYGVHRRPALPSEVGGPLVEGARPLDDPRARVPLSRELLTDGARHLTGIVVITHSETTTGTMKAVGAHPVMPIVLQSFAGSAARDLRAVFFPTAAALARLPTWELGHSVDADVRRAAAAHHLEAAVVSAT